MAGPALMLAPIANAGDKVPAEILFGGEAVVGAAAQGDVVEAMFTALREGYRVMSLETRRFAAALTRVAPVRAASGIALEDSAPERRRDVPAAPARMLVFGLAFTSAEVFVRDFGRKLARHALPRGGGAPLAFELGHEGPHCTQVQVSKIGAWGCMREQGLGPLNEPDVLFTRLELHPMSLRFQPGPRELGPPCACVRLCQRVLVRGYVEVRPRRRVLVRGYVEVRPRRRVLSRRVAVSSSASDSLATGTLELDGVAVKRERWCWCSVPYPHLTLAFL